MRLRTHARLLFLVFLSYQISRYPTVPTRLQFKSSQVLNLNQMLDPLSSQKCFVLIDNFNGIDFQEITHPVILRRLVRSQRNVITKEKFESSSHSVWMLSTISEPRFINTTKNIVHSSLSKFLREVGTIRINKPTNKDVFVRLDHFLFASQTKPWNCQVQILLGPSPEGNHAVALPKSPKIFQFILPALFYMKWLPSRVPHVSIMISHKKHVDTLKNTHFKEWMKNIDLEGRPVNDLYMVVTTEIIRDQTCTIRAICDVKANLESVHILRLCYACRATPQLLMNMVDLTRISFSQLEPLEKLSTLAFPRPDQRIIWITKLFDQLVCAAGTTSGLTYFRRIFLSRSQRQKLSLSLSHIWMSLMKNNTLFTKYHKCSNERLIAQKVADEDAIFSIYFQADVFHNSSAPPSYPLIVPRRFDQFKFVSCGKRGMDTTSFSELTRVYDRYIWIFMLISVIILANSFNCLKKYYKRQSYSWKYFLSTGKVLLEQGGDFSGPTFQTLPFRLIIGAFLLVSVVLSNAYKNSNVYNMISPSTPDPYEMFSELIQDNFKIYTRMMPLVFQLNPNDSDCCGPIKLQKFPHEIFDEQKRVEVASEVSWFFVDPLSPEKNLTDEEAFIMKHTSFHKFLHRAFTRMAEQVVNNTLNARKNSRALDALVLRKFNTEMVQEEERKFWKFMNDCNRSALMLPVNLCNYYARQLAKVGHQHVFIGKESFSNASSVIKISGPVPSFVTQRINGLKATGIVEWWLDMIDYGRSFRSTDWHMGHLERPTMQGNISKIFFLLVAGLLLAITSFSLEWGKVTHKKWRKQGRKKYF